jgi:hypothetical protein
MVGENDFIYKQNNLQENPKSLDLIFFLRQFF